MSTHCHVINSTSIVSDNVDKMLFLRVFGEKGGAKYVLSYLYHSYLLLLLVRVIPC